METQTKQPIIRDGLIWGYRLYDHSGVLFSDHFTGYEWILQEESIEDIKHHASGHFFESGATRFFNSRYPQSGIRKADTVYFITSEQFDYKSARLYTIRSMSWTTGKIDTVGEFQEYGTKAKAIAALKKILRGE